MPLVVDASAAVELLLQTATGLRVSRALRSQIVAAPAHFDAEVLSALGRLARSGAVPEGAVEAALTQLARAPITRYPVAPLLSDAWRLRANISLRDGLYVALSRHLRAALVTSDSRLARAPALGVTFTLVG